MKKVGEGDYRVIRLHKFIMIVDEYDTGAFPNRVLAEEHAMTLNREEKRKGQNEIQEVVSADHGNEH